MHILIMHWPKSIQVVTIYQDLISASQYSSTLLVGTTKKKSWKMESIYLGARNLIGEYGILKYAFSHIL